MKLGRVYKIITAQSNACYVGSTFDELNNRFKGHKNSYKTGKNQCSVVDLFDKYGVKNCKMILIKEYEVLDRRHLTVYETLWIKKLKAINKCEPVGGLLPMKLRAKLRNEKQKQEKLELKIKEELKLKMKEEEKQRPKGPMAWKRIYCEKCKKETYEHFWNRHLLSKVHTA